MKKIYALLIGLFCLGMTAQAQFNVTFQVDMSNEVIADTISVAGSFQAVAGFPADWTPGSTVLTDPDNDSIYSITVNIPADTFRYKFINGTGWSVAEGVPGGCNVGGDRQVIIQGDTTLDVVCFGLCTACPTSVDTVEVTFMVDMANEMIADSVTIAGDFQGASVGQSWPNWTPGVTLLEDPDNDSVYTLTVMLPEGTYRYKYINGTGWGFAEGVPGNCNVGGDRELNVQGPGPMVVPVHCFASCDTCTPVLPPINVTFRVDMTNEVIASQGLFVAGSFQSPAWEKDSLEMTDPNSDMVFEFTESVVPGEYEFKYFNGGSADPQDGEFGQNNPGNCAASNPFGGYNRILDIRGRTTDTILPVWEYNTCNEVLASLVGQLNASELFQVYPNPIQNTATVRMKDYDHKAYDIRLYNLVGQTMLEKNNIKRYRFDISAEGLNNGIYFLEVRKANGQKATHKVIIE